jgi:hypothetical protein
MRFVIRIGTTHGTVWHSVWGWVARPQHATLYQAEQDALAVAARFGRHRRATVMETNG